MGLAMAQQQRQAPVQVKDDPFDTNYHHNQHTQQHQTHQPPIPRPPSVVQQQQPTQHSQTPPQTHQQSPYAPVYHQQQPQQQARTGTGQHTQDIYGYQTSAYHSPAPSGGYTSAEMMAATMSRPSYPPMSYHTPQSNSPASVGSAPGHDQQRSLYAQPPPQLQQPSLYYSQQPQYQPLPPTSASPYGQHTAAPHQSMAPQPSMMMSHGAPSPIQHQMAQHTSQHSPSAMGGSPRHAKMELQSLTPQLSRQAPPAAPSPLSMGQVQPQTLQTQGMQAAQSVPQHASHQHPQHSHSQHPHSLVHAQQPQHVQHTHPHHAQQQQQSQHQHQQHTQHSAQQNGAGSHPGSQTGSSGSSMVNPNAAPGPIPATTPLVVRQDQNGVQWIAFEYSRDRVKMEYTIRCDVESVSTDDLSPEFKQENCVYPRACCPREQYRGNRLQYESECNTVGWALAQLNPSLRGKRGLIQRAVDSWRNSNQDPRLRSRRVRRMAKMGSRKAASGMVQTPSHLAGTATLPSAATSLTKPMSNMPQMHHHDTGAHTGGDEVGDSGESFLDNGQHQPSQSPAGSTVAGQEVRQAHVFHQYGSYGGVSPNVIPAMSPPVTMAGGSSAGFATVKREIPQPVGLFPDLSEAKKRKFVLVEDRGSRVRVRVTLDAVDTNEIPDSFRRSNAVCPGSFFPIEMESPPPSPTGRRFFPDDEDSDEDDGVEVEARGRSTTRRHRGRHSRRAHTDKQTMQVAAPVDDGVETEVDVPRMRKSLRRKQVRLNDLGCRMAWLQSRAFAGRRIFLQKALDTYRGKTCSSIVAAMQDIDSLAPHYEMRIGKKRWQLCEQHIEMRQACRT